MKTKIVKVEDGTYKRIDSSKCPWGHIPSTTQCGLSDCTQQCIITIPLDQVPKRLLK